MMAIECSPQRILQFSPPFTEDNEITMTLSNPHDVPMAFKVLVTSLDSFSVYPHMGHMEPRQDIKVRVRLNAVEAEPPRTAKCKHKMKILSVAVTPERERFPIRTLWKNVPEDAVHARKLRVEYVFPETSLVQKTPDLYHTKDLEAKLENAQAEVARLRSLIASGSASVIHDGTPYAAAAQSSLKQVTTRGLEEASLLSESPPAYREYADEPSSAPAYYDTKLSPAPDVQQSRRSSRTFGRLSQIFSRAFGS